ncbi:restriction endonuclease [Mariniphaga sediminis]|uniref:Restriction endonuclease n=1 Tax=Mariniphaga sediminis TaxID=1628158 RepID=A0A399D2S6_9BACT|nr:restriction endonuclease [Mariniphaga sediminis]RIH66184.1 restriction endonuclease [Mariniphaga sediminis]
MNPRIEKICKEIAALSSTQIEVIEQIIEQFSKPYLLIHRNSDSDLINDSVLKDFGDTLRIHHCFSHEPFRKDKFEYALERILKLNGYNIIMPRIGNPGHDIEINNVKVSLKTQADRDIKLNKVHISKFMELGKGSWGDNPDDLNNLMDLFFNHMKGYQRIFTLRCLSKKSKGWKYELVEIPKSLLQEAENGQLRMMLGSKQTPKPGYCDVFDDLENLKFQLYFDGGSERKLQIKNLLKKYCIVHASWSFESIDI